MVLLFAFLPLALAFESAKVFGSIDIGYYFVDIFVGSPPMKQTVIIDTGSLITAFPCEGWNNWGKHIDAYFNPENSSTSRQVGCDEDINCSQCRDELCRYQQSYAEGSSIAGSYWEDYMYFGDDFEDKAAFVFGCHDKETNLFVSQEADGIMGISNRLSDRDKKSLIDVLFADHEISADLFSLCLATENGTMTIGGYNSTYHHDTVQWIPFLENVSHYGVSIKAIQVDDVKLDVADEISKAIVDSGTTFTYLASNIYHSFWDSFKAYCEANECKGQKVNTMDSREPCFLWPHDDLEELIDSFPIVAIEFDGGSLVWEPVNYLYRSYGNHQAWCVGVLDNGSRNSVIGAVTMRGYDLIFDRSTQHLGLAPANCNYLNQEAYRNFTQLQSDVRKVVKVDANEVHGAVYWIFYICLGFSIGLLTTLLGYILYTCMVGARKGYNHLNLHDKTSNVDGSHVMDSIDEYEEVDLRL